MLVFLTGSEDRVFREHVVKRLKAVRTGIKFRKITFTGELYYPVKGEVCVGLGEHVVTAMQKDGLLPRNKKLGKFREQPINCIKGGKWLLSHSPESLDTDITKEPELMWDITLADRLDRTGSTEACIGEYEYVKHFGETIQYIRDKHEATGKKVTVALDTETMGLNPFDPKKKIVCIQITVRKGQAQVAHTLKASPERFAVIKKQLNWVLNTDTVNLVGANLKYDLLWIRSKFGITCSNFFFDTLLAGGLINENRSNSLSNHTKEYIPALGGYDSHLNDEYDKGEMQDIPKDDLLQYSGGDSDSCYQISNQMRREFKNERGLQNFYFNLLHPAARAFEEIEYNGLVINRDRFTEVREIIQKEEDRCREELLKILPRKLKAKHQKKDNVLAPAVIAEYLFTPYGLNLKPKQFTPKTKDLPIGERKPSTSKDHFMMFEDNKEAKHFIDLYKKLNQSHKAKAAYIDTFIGDLREDGKLHPVHLLYKGGLHDNEEQTQGGTVTGRLSVKSPAIQCMVGETLVFTDKGEVPLMDIVSAYERGTSFAVLTHTGEWQPIIGVYRNGIKPIYRIITGSGKEIKCTGNHPVLTNHGFVLAEALSIGDTVLSLNKENRDGFKKIRGVGVRKIDGAAEGRRYNPPSTNMPMQLRKSEEIQVLSSSYWQHKIVRLFKSREGQKQIKEQGRSTVWQLGCVAEAWKGFSRSVALSMRLRQRKPCFWGGFTSRKYNKLWLWPDKSESESLSWVYEKPGTRKTWGVPHLFELDQYEEQVQEYKVPWVQGLWRTRCTDRCQLGEIRELFVGLRGDAERPQPREAGRQWQLHQRELLLAAEGEAVKKHQKDDIPNIQGRDAGQIKYGRKIRCAVPPVSRKVKKRVGDSEGNRDTRSAMQAGCFEEEKIISITKEHPEETYDLTIRGSHSFVANGVVVHNTLPKHMHKNPWAKLLRSCYVAPPGYVMWACDFSQGELRIMACVSEDETMVQAYLDGIDLHALTGAKSSGRTLEEVLSFAKTDPDLFDKIRLNAKGQNFGLIFLQQAKGYKEYLRVQYGITVSLEEAQRQIDVFFRTYPRVQGYHNRTIRRVHEDKKVTSLLGRVRHLPTIDSPLWGIRTKAERQAVNSQIQSVLSDMCIWAISFIAKKYPKKDVWIATMIHDSIVGYVREDRATEILRDIKGIMENLPLEKTFGWKPQIPFPVDCEVGPDLASMKKIKL